MSVLAQQFVSVRVEGAVGIVTIAREPVNTMNLDLWRELKTALEFLEKDKKVRGAIFTSGLKRPVFTAGNDITELASTRTTKERFVDFWKTQNTFLARLYVSRLVTAAAIRGQCPAGGCVLAMVCDYRVMSTEGNNPTIGLNEVAVGITPPKWWGRVMAALVGPLVAERMLITAHMATPGEAKSIHLVDDVVDDSAQLVPACLSLMKPQLSAPPLGMANTKRQTRGELATAWERELPNEAAMMWVGLCDKRISGALEATLARLSGGAKKAKL